MTSDPNQTEQQKLVDILKFTPQRVHLSLNGWGGEVWAGRVERRIYDFFRDHRYSLEEYAADWDCEWSDRVPEDVRPFEPGCAYNCDDVFHETGVTLDGHNIIQIADSAGRMIWEHNLDAGDLEKSGVTVEQTCGGDIADMVDTNQDPVVIYGQNGEKGCFFEAEFVLYAPFDPAQLIISFVQYEDWYIVIGVEYAGESLDGSDGYNTRGKSSSIEWLLFNDETVYEPRPIEDQE